MFIGQRSGKFLAKVMRLLVLGVKYILLNDDGACGLVEALQTQIPCWITILEATAGMDWHHVRLRDVIACRRRRADGYAPVRGVVCRASSASACSPRRLSCSQPVNFGAASPRPQDPWNRWSRQYRFNADERLNPAPWRRRSQGVKPSHGKGDS